MSCQVRQSRGNFGSGFSRGAQIRRERDKWLADIKTAHALEPPTLTARVEPQARLVLGVVTEVGGGDDAVGQSGALQQRPQVVPPTVGEQLGAQEQCDDLRFAARLPVALACRWLCTSPVTVAVNDGQSRTGDYLPTIIQENCRSSPRHLAPQHMVRTNVRLHHRPARQRASA